MATSHLIEVLGGPRVLKKIRTEEDLRERLRDGLPFASFEALGSAFRLNPKDLGAVLGVPERTLARRKLQKHLRPDESDRLVRLARVAALAEEVLGSREKAAAWLSEPSRALGGGTPVVRLDTDLGARQVELLLGRIAHGIYS